jgi:hypothetical protein
MTLSKSATRVREHTSDEINDQIRQQTERNISYYALHPELIEERLAELDEEWDVERALETGSSSLSLLGLTLGFTVSRKWFLLPLTVQGFFLQHALQGWCPPLPLFRRLGLRTQSEIATERYALKALRGDFRNLAEMDGKGVEEVLRAVRP